MASINIRSKHVFILSCLLLSFIALNDGGIHRTRKASVQTKTQQQSDDHEATFDGIQQGEEDDAILGNKYVCAVLATILVGLTGVLPLALPIDTKQDNGTDQSRRLNLFLSFAVGGLLGDVFLHLLPEAFSRFEAENRLARVKHGVLFIAGLMVFLIIERMCDEKDAPEKDEEPERKSGPTLKMTNGYTTHRATTTNNNLNKRKTVRNGHHPMTAQSGRGRKGSHDDSQSETATSKVKNKQVTGYLNLLANFIDNFTHGLAVGGSFMVSTKVGWHTTLAILLHEAPHEIGDFAILLRSGFGRVEAAKAQMLTSVGGLIGCAVALVAESAEIAGTSSAWILPFTSGGFLNIALVTLLPDLMKEPSIKESFKQVCCLLVGVAVMASVNIFQEH